MIRTMALLCLSLLLVNPSLVQADETPASPIHRELQRRVETIQRTRKLIVSGVRISRTDIIADLYPQTGFEPVWTEPKDIDDLLRAIKDIYADGLNPQDYYLDKLAKMRAQVLAHPDPASQADFDILLTDALARLAYNAFYGKVDPRRIDENVNAEHVWTGSQGATAVREFLASPSLYDKIESLKPARPKYDMLRKALAQYREYEKAGGWGTIPSGKVLSVGTTDKRVPAIRHRLAITGDLPANLDNGDQVYDAELEAAVHRFQRRHRLPEGDLSRLTINAMNVPAKKRVDQIRVNLERARWILRDIKPTMVFVNIAAFEIYFMKDGKRVWQNEAQVGKTFTKTPIFTDDIEYLVLNPTWTVPPGVLADSVLPAAKRNPAALKEKNIRVFDASGKEVPAASVNWKRYTAENLPYKLRQDPGPDNALGAAKFMFPNPYHVYLHDTPNKLGYDRRLRAMSWGCIHVQDPIALAALVVGDPNWSLEALQEQVESGKTKTIHFAHPVPVALLYWTVDIADDGDVVFYPDVYDRDGYVLRALNGPFKMRMIDRRN